MFIPLHSDTILSQISDSKSTVNFLYFFAQNMKFLENEIEYSKNISFVKSLDPNG